jgi:hypothetical protein
MGRVSAAVAYAIAALQAGFGGRGYRDRGERENRLYRGVRIVCGGEKRVPYPHPQIEYQYVPRHDATWCTMATTVRHCIDSGPTGC